MKLTKTMIVTIPLMLGGCLTTRDKTETVYSQSMTRAQIEQVKIEQQQKQKVSQKNTSQTTVYQDKRVYNGYSKPARRPDLVSANQQPYVAPYQPQSLKRVDYNQRRQEEANRQAIEASQMEQARQNSLITAAQEEARRRELAAQEARDIEQAKQNSLRTYAEEKARRDKHEAIAQEEAQRRESAAQEARDLEKATQESLRSFAEEEARRKQAEAVTAPPLQAAKEPVQGRWKPSEGDLVRAGDLLMEQKKSNGGIDPSYDAKLAHIQSSMGVSSEQASKILRKLGLS